MSETRLILCFVGVSVTSLSVLYFGTRQLPIEPSSVHSIQKIEAAGGMVLFRNENGHRVVHHVSLSGAKQTIDDDWCENVFPISGLRSLNLDGCSITEKTLQLLAKQGSLEELDITRTATRSIEPLAAIPGLQQLDIIDIDLSLSSCPLSAIRTLSRVNCSFATFNDQFLSGVGEMDRLESVRAIGVKIAGSIGHICRSRTLRILELGDIDICDSCISCLLGIESLERLDIKACSSVTIDAIPAIAKHPRLRQLEVSGMPLGPSHLRLLTDSGRMESIWIGGGSLLCKDDVIDATTRRPGLKVFLFK